MNLRFRKAIGAALAVGMTLQLACASLASFIGDCPIAMPVVSASLPHSENAATPPCHQSKEEGTAEKPATNSGDCCGKEVSFSLADTVKSLDWEKLYFQPVILSWFYLPKAAIAPVFEKGSFYVTQFELPSSANSLSLLQVYLI